MINLYKKVSVKIFLTSCLLVPIIISCLLFLLLDGRKGYSKSSDLVKISIFSKHIRLLREGKYKSIRISFPDSAVIENGDGSIEEIRDIDILYEDGYLRLLTGKREYYRKFHIIVPASGENAVFKIYLPGEVRIYPLPVEFMGTESSIDIIVTEGLSRYIVDSAVAEYGRLPSRCDEAIKALSIVIDGRYYFNRRKPVHKNYDFCDLTHCQVYRGRISDGSGYREYPDWTIDVDSLPMQLLFHSRCGGKTFDGRIFSHNLQKSSGIRDWISDQGLYLCRDKRALWENSISEKELLAILFKKKGLNDRKGLCLVYNMKRLRIILKGSNYYREFYPEDFRLRINRVKGWNFIKSNNYRVTSTYKGGERSFTFSGIGLGHGVGLCQHGSLSLARMGYSRYEIIEHYFRGISFKHKGDTAVSTPYLAYTVFSLRSGRIEKCSYKRLLHRKISPGSIFKILVSLYIANERQDLLRDYRYLCKGKSEDKNLPERCWSPDGHGLNDLSSALSISCNLYFASLYKHINYSSFKKFTENFLKLIGVQAGLPDIKGDRDFARLLSGLDFRMKFSVRDLMMITQFIASVCTDNYKIERAKKLFSAERDVIYTALINTVERGTASGSLKPYGSEMNYLPLMENDAYKNIINTSGHYERLWGKTSTVIDGTNKKHSYGFFIGGDDERGVVVILRKGNGHVAAKWGIVLLKGGLSEK